MPNCDKRGMVLFIVIGIIMVVVILSTVILRVIANHARLTHHQVVRIQAQYVAQAGIVYALEMLRTGTWQYPTNCANPTGCLVQDPSFPYYDFPSQMQARVIFCTAGTQCGGAPGPPSKRWCVPPTNEAFCINSTVDFPYTP